MAVAVQKVAEPLVKAQHLGVVVAIMGGVEAGTIIVDSPMAAVQSLERVDREVA